MTWFKFWKAGERYFDRFYCTSVTLWVLKVGGYLSVPWTPVIVCSGVAFVGCVICGTIASTIEPNPQTNP